MLDEVHDLLRQFLQIPEVIRRQNFSLQHREPDLNLVQPRWVSRESIDHYGERLVVFSLLIGEPSFQLL